MSRASDEESSEFREPKKILILGPNLGEMSSLIDLYRGNGHLVIGGDDKFISKEDLRKTIDDAGGIDSSTIITICGHGLAKKGHHYIDVLEETDITSELFETLTEISGGKSLNLNLYSCFGGAAASDVDKLPTKSCCIFHGPEDQSILAFNASRSVAEHIDDSGYAIADLFIGAPYEMHNLTISVKLKDGEVKSTTLRPPTEAISSIDDISRYVSAQWVEKLGEEFGSIEQSLLPDNFGLEYLPNEEQIMQIFLKKADEYAYSLLATKTYQDASNKEQLEEFLQRKRSEDPDRLDELLKQEVAGRVSFSFLLDERRDSYNLILDQMDDFASNEIDLAESLLIQNIQAKNIDGIRILLERGADLDPAKSNGVRPLHLASKETDLSIVDLFLERGEDINAKDFDGKSPIFYAIKNKATKTVIHLIERGADITIKDNEGRTPLDYAIESRDRESVTALCAKGAKFEDKDLGHARNLLFHALVRKKYEDVIDLYSAGAGLNKEDAVFATTSLFSAVKSQKLEVVKLLTENNAQVNMRDGSGMLPLDYAVLNNDQEIAIALLEKTRNLNTESLQARTRLNFDFEARPTEGLQLSSERTERFKVSDFNGENMLHKLAKSGKSESFVQIIETIDPKIATKLLVSKDSNGQKPIDIIVENANLNDENAKNELKKIAKHIGGILRDRGIVTEKTTWQSLADSFQSLCKAIGIKTEREKVRESIMMSEERETNDYANQLKNALKKTMDKLPAPTTGPVMRPRARGDTGMSI